MRIMGTGTAGWRATNDTKEKIGVGCTGIGQRAPSCPRKDGVVGDTQGCGRRDFRHLLT